MYSIHNKIWNELIQTNYSIEKINIHIFNYTNIGIEIKFVNLKDLIKLSEHIFNLIYISLIFDYTNNTTNLYLDIDLINKPYNLSFPSNVNELELMINDDLSTNIKFVQNIFNLLKNLPENLYQLKINTSIPFDISNLPTKLFLLDITNSYYKFDINYLPNSIKILYLPSINLYKIKSQNSEYIYKLDDFMNLPTSINEINFGEVCIISNKKIIDKIYDLLK